MPAHGVGALSGRRRAPLQGTYTVIDFETTGMYAGSDRVIEAAAVVVEDGVITRRFQSLANPGLRIPAFITGLTGISNAMVKGAPPTGEVMAQLADFLGGTQPVAHNAAFDSRFLAAELAMLGLDARQDWLCTLLLSRRVLRGASSYALGNIARHAGVAPPAQAHRALADAETAALLLVSLGEALHAQLGLAAVDADILRRAQSIAPAQFALRAPRLLGSAH